MPEIAHGAVSQIAGATQRVADLRVKFADESAGTRKLVVVFNNKDFRSVDTRNIVPPISALIVAEPRDGGRRGAHPAGDRITGYGREFRSHAMHSAAHVSLIAHAHVERFDCIRYGASVRMAQERKKFGGYLVEWFHVFD